MVREVASSSQKNMYHKLQQSPAMPLPQRALPEQNLPVPLQKTALQGLELELGLSPVPRRDFGLLRSRCPARCCSEDTQHRGQATRSCYTFVGDGVTTPSFWMDSRLFSCFLSP